MTVFASLNVGRTLFYLIDVLKGRPDLVREIRNELETVIGDQLTTPEHLRQLVFLRAVISEALWQLTPIPSFPRVVLQDVSLMVGESPVTFKKGDFLVFLFRTLQGEPREFSPEPWLRGNVEERPTLWAFGKGHRQCPAEPFAYQLISQFIVGMFRAGIQIVPTEPTEYTTRFGGLGPAYSSEKPIYGQGVRD